MRKKRILFLHGIKIWLLIAVLTICRTASFASCSSNKDNPTEQSSITTIADKVWAFSQSHPDGFTIDIRTMTEPTEGIAVTYAATQNSHSRNQLNKVVRHALKHDGYVGGCYPVREGERPILRFHPVHLHRNSHRWQSSGDRESRNHPLWYYRRLPSVIFQRGKIEPKWIEEAKKNGKLIEI